LGKYSLRPPVPAHPVGRVRRARQDRSFKNRWSTRAVTRHRGADGRVTLR